jgi:hypothetical protein
MCSRGRCIAGELISLGAQPLDIGVNVIGPETEVMQSSTALIKVSRNRPGAVQWMHQFYVRRGHAKKCRRGLSRLHHLVTVMLEPKILKEPRYSALKIWYGNRDMVQCSNHETTCLSRI